MSNPTDSDHVTLFRGAADNTYFELYFNALPSPGAENVQLETHEVDLKPDREVILHVEIFNPTGKVPLIVTPGGMGECDGFRGFARNVAAASSELKVIIWDRRNMGRSEVSFGTEPLAIEEAEDLHVLIQRLGVGPATLYGMWTYPEKVEGLLID
jgi:pimeloyl-ACP methyl ester carboxylesterase